MMDLPGGLQLAPERTLVYVLHTGVTGRLQSGRIERDPGGLLLVYTQAPTRLNAYISGTNLRSWCVVGPGRQPLPGWCNVTAEDHDRLLKNS